MQLYKALADDLPETHALIERAYRGDSARLGWTHEADLLSGQRTDEASLAAMVEESGQHLLVHRDGGKIVSCIALTEKPGALIYIGMVTVEPGRQSQGLGKRLLHGAERYAVDILSAERAEMTVIGQRQELIAWYERRGYRLTGERRPFPILDRRFGKPTRQDLDFVVLEKSLRSPAPEA